MTADLSFLVEQGFNGLLSSWSKLGIDGVVETIDLAIQVPILVGREGLSSVAQCLLRARMYLDDQPVGSDRHTGTRERFDHIVVTGRV